MSKRKKFLDKSRKVLIDSNFEINFVGDDYISAVKANVYVKIGLSPKKNTGVITFRYPYMIGAGFQHEFNTDAKSYQLMLNTSLSTYFDHLVEIFKRELFE